MTPKERFLHLIELGEIKFYNDKNSGLRFNHLISEIRSLEDLKFVESNHNLVNYYFSELKLSYSEIYLGGEYVYISSAYKDIYESFRVYDRDDRVKGQHYDKEFKLEPKDTLLLLSLSKDNNSFNYKTFILIR